VPVFVPLITAGRASHLHIDPVCVILSDGNPEKERSGGVISENSKMRKRAERLAVILYAGASETVALLALLTRNAMRSSGPATVVIRLS